ncbi:bifunctional aminoglycoside phosphotransferase/ATP-binding protein [Geobacter sp. AOG2]|uniref:bifunctional aminoglycoside phosphotransferase/ATP-binding protein n=1 Tax=Geobacter sp. AOG2 TaxID=1566347 RepID=UPI001CC74EA3|nr:bifunctional aminoglycoside phosphotransferase/ATP-binding protein [Geobacter sp. AOG2]
MKHDAYPEVVSSVELIQTHVSWIFLAGDTAYKIKKPVDFGFLNFSTIDRRRFYCHEEVRLNSRLCPDIYLGVVEVRESPGGAAFFGDGPIIDYAVKMKRLPAERMLDRLVEHGEVTSADMRAVARVIAAFHHAAATSPAISEYGQRERIMANWQENLDQSADDHQTPLSADELEVIREWVSSFVKNRSELFEKRISGGFIRECDGDIHLENICLTDGKIYIFDCIEFNERFRYCDTAADIAFLLMDLDFHRRRDLAEAVLDEYLAASGDTGLCEVIDFYKLYRAFVRGKVESFRQNDGGIDPQERELAGGRSAAYFRLARGYLERQRLKTTLFITCGLTGSGKSTLAAQLAFELGIATYNSDRVRKQMAALPPDTAMHVPFETGLYSAAASEATYAELLRLAEAELAAGRSVIIDACFISREQRHRFGQLAASLSLPFVVLHCSCPDTEQRRRLLKRESSGESVSDGRLEILELQQNSFQPPDDSEGTVLNIATATPPGTLASQIYARLMP